VAILVRPWLRKRCARALTERAAGQLTRDGAPQLGGSTRDDDNFRFTQLLDTGFLFTGDNSFTDSAV